MTEPALLHHRTVPTASGDLHLVEQGTGPLVLLLHGFPETWRAWRAQLPALAAAGFRAVALDLRGNGTSSAPADVAAYRLEALVEDVVTVVHALGESTAVVVGHDVGSPVAAGAALLRPDVVRAVGLLGVPYTPPGGPRPSEVFAHIGGPDAEFYVSWFQEPGRAEADIEHDPRAWLTGFTTGLSGESHASPGPDGLFFVPRGARMSDRFPDDPAPAWLDPADLDAAAAELTHTGATGALNRYRNADRDWTDLAGHTGAHLTQPAVFIGGELDATSTWLADVIATQAETVPGLRSSTLLPGCGHWVQRERPEEVNRLLTEWLADLPTPA
ncbi:alpha/beta hydrolase [Modestobacter sp. L9-4]|uniref:alpha/beta fold hydrolase n=1 Tax=Modestobacter sp. L9-4 TaxID=2851567 RepID=UPI001C76A716|nr:alpha/beta hydrolase [Modestobacter sp. L9-4]QXG77651.1 alpha/beta hydrolase [Modestobacter sp. L9-4]